MKRDVIHVKRFLRVFGLLMDQFILHFNWAFENMAKFREMGPSSLESGPNDNQGSICRRKHLKRYEDEGDRFFNRIVAIDETWLRSYEPGLKSQFSECQTPGLPRSPKFRRNLKQLEIIAYDSGGLLATDYIPLRQTVYS